VLLAAAAQLVRQFGQLRATREFQCLEGVSHDKLVRRGKQRDRPCVALRVVANCSKYARPGGSPSQLGPSKTI
jgi:hypothetical protein